jgi:hypothetical protein
MAEKITRTINTQRRVPPMSLSFRFIALTCAESVRERVGGTVAGRAVAYTDLEETAKGKGADDAPIRLVDFDMLKSPEVEESLEVLLRDCREFEEDLFPEVFFNESG